ncbi:MAG: LysR family transcriptional regulator [Bacteroidales bacterium]|nr:LysR family transcriptional regulator [Bacteroidales bacterium]
MNNLSSKYCIKHKVWIENKEGQGLLGDGKWELLKLINEKGSLKAAIEEMGWGYRSTWSKLKDLEKRLDFAIIEKSRGGIGGGGQTVLTEKGKALVNCFQELHNEVDKMLKVTIENYSKKLNQIGNF